MEKMEKMEEMEDRLELITRNLQEIVGIEELKHKIENNESIKVYWGTAITGKPHLGYFVPMLKIADLLKAGCEVTILLADLHGYLDNLKTNWDLLKVRITWYELIIKNMLRRINVNTDKLKFVTGSSFQLCSDYTMDMYKLSAMSTTVFVEDEYGFTEHMKHASSEVVKHHKNPLMSGLLYPILQALDEQYLNVDIQLGGVDQRKIFMFAREHLPKIGYKKRIHLMNPLVPGLGKSGKFNNSNKQMDNKMSSSDTSSKIDFNDSDETIIDKIRKTYSVDGVSEGNALLSMLKLIIFPLLHLQSSKFLVEREEKYGGNVIYNTYEDVENAFNKKELSSIDLKASLSCEIIRLIDPIRMTVLNNILLMNEAYP